MLLTTRHARAATEGAIALVGLLFDMESMTGDTFLNLNILAGE